MNPALGQHLMIRAMVYVAGKPVPFFWPMRSFIHHNPLHGLEHMEFADAVEAGGALFHARGFLNRDQYQDYLARGEVDRAALEAQVGRFVSEQVARRGDVHGVDLRRCLMALLTQTLNPIMTPNALARGADVHAALAGRPIGGGTPPSSSLRDGLRERLLGGTPVQEAIDALHGTAIADEVDEQVIHSCLDFFDEGQAVWSMPGRERGFFQAWRDVSSREVRRLLDRIAAAPGAGDGDDSASPNTLNPEAVIDHIMGELGVPQSDWPAYFTREIARLHGWAGFIRWRATAQHYHWSEQYPGDLVDLLAVRLTLAHVLIQARARGALPRTRPEIEARINDQATETWLRLRYHGGDVLPQMAHRVDVALSRGKPGPIATLFSEYADTLRAQEARTQAERLKTLSARAGKPGAFETLAADDLARAMEVLRDFERHEGMIWLRAMETHAMDRILADLSLRPEPERDKRPFVQALFCIDTRSERIRRHLESVGDYQTFGIAGFFGVPVSFMELGKGSENHLCPVLLTPKNLVLEMSTAGHRDPAAITALEKAMHELKESVLSPFVTVEAIGLLFGLDMVGKTLLPQTYHRWRGHLDEDKPSTHLLLDKLSREQADSIVRTVQRTVIEKAIEQEFDLPPERITDDMVRELREAALFHRTDAPALVAALDLYSEKEQTFIARLRSAYRINPQFARLQMEQLGRIGFSTDEQARFVATALTSIGLTGDFSRFILLTGHGSQSENNPYESALDCGACGGDHGLTNARVLAQMANKPRVRAKLKSMDLEIPDDSWFLPALHNTTTDEIELFDLELLPASHLVYLDRLRNGLTAAARLCAQERLPSLRIEPPARDQRDDPGAAMRGVQRNAMDWSQVRPEWGLSRNAYFVIGRRELTRSMALEGRAFLHSYDYRADPKNRLLENILTGPLVVGQWINMEHYFSTVDNERFGSGSKVYHNVAGRFGVMTGNLSDLRTGLPAQTVLEDGKPYHQPLRLITVIEAPFKQAMAAVQGVVAVKRLVNNGWIRLMIIDPETHTVCIRDGGTWHRRPHVGPGHELTPPAGTDTTSQELCA
ncbi:MAG: DUF2309 domain-containing protein [Gammaproteobacteria bacterium]